MTSSTVVPPTTECDDQKRLFDSFFEADGPRWVIWLDGARYDYFVDLYPDYIEGDLTAVWNRDMGYTGDWSEAFLRQEFPDMGLFSPVPLYTLQMAEYDERKWFDVTPDYREYDDDDADVEERLAALGYREHTGDDIWDPEVFGVNDMVRDHLDEVSGGIIRYVDPHPPLEELKELTTGSGKLPRVRNAIESGDITQDELAEAYVREYQTALEGVVDIVPDLPGEVVVTADHGEALYENCCKQVFHARGLTPCPCFTVVPWFEVEGVT